MARDHKAYPNPEEFKPERFLDTDSYQWPRDGCECDYYFSIMALSTLDGATPVLPFSAGARGCIGQRFALTESVCFLAALARRYEILPSEEHPVGASKADMEAYRRRMLKWTTGITVTPVDAFVKLRRY